MTENAEQSGTESTSTSTAPKQDPVAEFKKMPVAEKILGAAAAATLLGFIIVGNWDLFKYRWFPTCAFLGSVGALALIITNAFGIKLLEARLRTYVLIGLAILPAVGFVVDALRDFWQAVMLAGAVMMGFAGVKITTREKII